MKFHVVTLFVIASALGVQCNLFSWVTNSDGSLSILDSSKPVMDSPSTLKELEKDVIFFLYTRANPTEGQQIYLNNDNTLSKSNYKASLKTCIIIHGWQNKHTDLVATTIRDAYLEEGDYNIIVVDWNSYASQNYVSARSKIITVGQYVGLMIDYLENKGMSVEDLIVAGHSLGAHVSGVACRSANSEVGVLFAMDPAGPLFYLIDTEARLRSTDAKFVQAIHTSAGTLGHSATLGTVDLWINGGLGQRGCGFDPVRICAHGRSYLYVAESIISGRKFLAHTCASGSCNPDTTTWLGGSPVDTSASGVFYLTTNSAPTYAMD